MHGTTGVRTDIYVLDFVEREADNSENIYNQTRMPTTVKQYRRGAYRDELETFTNGYTIYRNPVCIV